MLKIIHVFKKKIKIIKRYETYNMSITLSENRVVFGSKHEPHSTDVLRVRVDFDSESQPHSVSLASQDLCTHLRPVNMDARRESLCKSSTINPNLKERKMLEIEEWNIIEDRDKSFLLHN